jgi:hypothetical protein
MYADWDATFRNWIARAPEFSRGTRPNGRNDAQQSLSAADLQAIAEGFREKGM